MTRTRTARLSSLSSTRIPLPSSLDGRFKSTGLAVRVEGLRELQRALARSESAARTFLRKELRDIAGDIKQTAQAYVPHKTGRHGGTDVPELAASIKTSVTQRGASVYSDAPHAIVQDVGGRVGHGAIIPRASASHYMTRAVKDAEPYVTKRLEMLLEELATEFGR